MTDDPGGHGSVLPAPAAFIVAAHFLRPQGMAGLSAAAQEEYKEYFALFDEDNDGEVHVKHLGPLLRALGQIPSEAEIRELQQDIGSDTFDFQELLKIMSRRLKECDPAEDIKEAFQVFDKSGTGVPVKELRHIMKSIGEKVTDAEFDELLKEINVPKDGKITYRDFIKVLPPRK